MSTLQHLDRKARLSALAKASPERLKALWHAWCADHGAPAHSLLRSPEIGTVMVRGRAGAVGAPFNLGEITVTRCSVQLGGGAVGHGYVQGRDREAATIAGLVDALAQADATDALDDAITRPLLADARAHAEDRANKAAATRVEFFTVARGDA